jgi:tetratricopeptide (TPR) repeat protein
VVVQWRSRILAAEGKDIEALGELLSGAERVKDAAPCLRDYVERATALGLSAEAEVAVQRLVRLGCQESSECTQNLTWAAAYERTQGRGRTALTFLRQAADMDPARLDLLETAAQSATQLGLYGEALGYYERLQGAQPSVEKWSEGIAAMRRALAEGALKLRMGNVPVRLP